MVSTVSYFLAIRIVTNLNQIKLPIPLRRNAIVKNCTKLQVLLDSNKTVFNASGEII